MNAHLSLSTTVVLTPHRSGLQAGADQRLDVLVRIQAPDAPAGHVAERPPQAMALVVDRSGSMAGRPLSEARRCAEYVLGKLRPTDSVSLVQFDHRVQRLWPAVPLGDATALRAAVCAIQDGGSTDLHAGWKEGADTLADVAGSGLRRVILLSDGQANHGLTEADAIVSQCAEWARRGITTSTYGLGNHFNESLMVAMARAGGGNHYYGDTAEDLMEPFEQELELLGNLCLRELHLSATVPTGVTVELVNDLPLTDRGWRLSDLAWGAEAWALLRLTVKADALPPIGSLMTTLRVAVDGLDAEGNDVRLERAGLALPVMSPAVFAGLADDEVVARRGDELAAASVLTAMRAAAAEGDWSAVDDLLEQASRRFAGNEWVAAMLQAMKALADRRARARMMKESLYSASRLASRLVAKDEDDRYLASAEWNDKPAYLRRKPSQGKGDA